MARMDTLRTVGGHIKETFKGYAAMQEAYDTAFDVEKGVYEADQEVSSDHPMFEDAESFGEMVTAYAEATGIDMARYLGDGFRAGDDDDLTALSDEMKEYAGGGLTGLVFSSFVVQEDYDTAAAIAGVDPETIEDDLGETVGQYHDLRAERYGLPRQEMDDEVVEKVEEVKATLRPLVDARQDGGDVVDMVYAAEELADQPEVQMAYEIAKSRITGEEPDMEVMMGAMGLGDLEETGPSPEDQQEAVEALMDEVLSGIEELDEDAVHIAEADEVFDEDMDFVQVGGDEPIGTSDDQSYETAQDFLLGVDEETFEAYKTVDSFKKSNEDPAAAGEDTLQEVEQAQQAVFRAALEAGLPEDELDELEERLEF